MEGTSTKYGIGLDTAVFVCGAVVMVFEITGSRVVSPFIGSSTYVWTSLIGVILAALSLGYWLGGRMADRVPKVKMLAAAITTAAALVALTVLIKDIVLSLVAAFPASLEIKAVASAILLFAPASVALGFVTPYAVRLRMVSVGEAGRTVGRLYALSTVGSIVGTFAAGFLLIPFLGTNRTLYLITAGLLLLPFLLIPFGLNRRNAGAGVLLLFGIAANETLAYAMWRHTGLLDVDTEYSRVRIFDTTDPATQRPIRALAFDPYSTQSAMFLDSDDLVFEYTKFYHLVHVLRPGFERSLMIGGAGYSFPKAYLERYPAAALDVVEIDPKLTGLAREHFRLRDDPRLNIFHEDGRVFLGRAEAGSYDAVLMDAFGSLLSVPFQLTTIEAVRHIHRVLDDRGVAIFNIGSAIDGPASHFLRAEVKTYQMAFPNVYVFKVRPERPDTDLQNLIVVACKTDCLPAQIPPDDPASALLRRRHTAPLTLDLPPLTDDLAPVERYNSIAHSR